jgi:hypothetical protein
MKEYMLLILNEIDHQKLWSSEQHTKFLKQCESYIGKLKADGKLIAAQPLAKEGVIISGSHKAWHEAPLRQTGEIQVGYYHILANDLDEAIAIAKANPEFEFSATACVEVRPIKGAEKETGFVYPK